MENVSTVYDFRTGPWRVKFQLLTVWLCGVAVVLSSIWLIARIVLILLDPAYAPPVIAPPPTAPAAAYSYFYELKDVTFPIFSKVKNRVMYVRFSLALDCSSAESKTVFDKSKPKILDTVLAIAANFSLEDFADANGFIRFKQQLLTALTKRFPYAPPRQISLEDWTIG